ncbi:hypothetical protein JCM10296v2_003352 [Rhodotorula toruloides]
MAQVRAAQEPLAANAAKQKKPKPRDNILYFGRMASIPMRGSELPALREVILQNLVVHCFPYMPCEALPMAPLTDRRDADFMHRLVCYVTLLTQERRLTARKDDPTCATALTAFVARHFDEHFVQEFELELPAIDPSMVNVTSVV